jgi:hypothetical protein
MTFSCSASAPNATTDTGTLESASSLRWAVTIISSTPASASSALCATAGPANAIVATSDIPDSNAVRTVVDPILVILTSPVCGLFFAMIKQIYSTL